MHVILASVGTDGDVYPYVGLGARLRAWGHRVTLVTNEHHRSLAVDHNLAFRALVSNEETEQVLGNPDFWHPVRSAPLTSRWGVRFLERQYALFAELASGGDTVLAASPGVVAARLVQEKLARPLASVILQPWLIPSVLAPPILPGLALPHWTPRPIGHLYWRLVDAVGDVFVGRHLNRIRASLDLRPTRRFLQWWLSPERIIGMFPDWYGPPQADWPPQVRLTGFPMYDGRPGARLSSDVAEFCRAGAPPVAFTLGTEMRHAEAFFLAAVEACRLLGRRGILLTKYGRLLPAPLPPFVRACEFAPFQQLFPLCAAVVHHGGVGTVAKALAAGVPQLVLPLAFDQIDNAPRVKRLGVGDWLKTNQRSSAQIAAALANAMTPQTQARCRTVAARLGKDDALDTAARWIEELAYRAPGSRCQPSALPEKQADRALG